MSNNYFYFIQKKKAFAKSIEPLKFDYSTILLIWRLNIFTMYSNSLNWYLKRENRIRKKFKKLGDSAQNQYIVLAFISLVVGLTQNLIYSTNLCFKDIATENLFIFHSNVCKRNWKTFHVRDVPYLLKAYSIYTQYQKVDFSIKPALIIPTHFYNNQLNQKYIGFTDLKSKFLIKNNFQNNHFKKNKFPIHIQTSSLTLADTIPMKLEGITKHYRKKDFIVLFKKFGKNKPQFTVEDSQKIAVKKLKKSSYKQIKLVKKINYNLLFKLFKKDSKLPKIKRLKNKELSKILRKKQLKKILFRLYKNIFYKEEYKYLNPQSVLTKKFKKAKRRNFVLRKLIRYNVTYFDIINIAQKNELNFFNSHLQPRLCSGYQWPDLANMPKYPHRNLEYALIRANLPHKYQSFFINLFSQSLKKQKKIINYSSKNTDENLYITKISEKVKPPTPEKIRYKNYRKQISIYRNFNFSPPINLWKLNRLYNIYFTPSTKTLFFKNSQFSDVREPIKPYSWLIITQIGVGLLGFKLLQNLYIEYGKEIVLSLINFIDLIGALPDAEWLREELNLSDHKKGYRAVRKVRKYFRQAAGITSLLVQLNEILWHLRTKQIKLSHFFHFLNYEAEKNRSFVFQPILLIGPPGTGKTLLVQALAGETGVSVLLQSGSVLKDFRQRGKGARSIQNLFRRARQITPCIVFIDELDGIGLRREGLSVSPTGENDTIDVINQIKPDPVSFDDIKDFKPKTQFKELSDDDEEELNFDVDVAFGETLTEASQKNLLRIKVLQESQIERTSRNEQLGVLTQLLIELDGLITLSDIMVLGATNRPHVLDPALLRPGRFYRVLKLSLPGENKRVEILKLYISYMRSNTVFPWNYLSRRMEGLSAADISAIVNESALISICKDQTHTVQSLEQGLERITTYSLLKNLINYKSRLLYTNLSIRLRWMSNHLFFKKYRLHSKQLLKVNKFLKSPPAKDFVNSTRFKNLAYYCAGKSIVHILLPNHPSSVYFAIEERSKNFRYLSMHGLVVSLMEQLQSRAGLEERLIGLLAGKASEFMFGYASICPHLWKSGQAPPFNASNVGEEDVQSATLLAFLMIEKWYFYAETICTQLQHPISHDFNLHEFHWDDVKLFQAIFEDIETEIEIQNRLHTKSQKWSFRAWWQKQLIDEESFFDRSLMDWYRIYMAEPDESERNIEWVPPDDYYNSLNIRMTSFFLYWHHFLKLIYDYLYHSLLLNGFSIAFNLVDQNCELLDYLVDFVLRHEKAREHQIRFLTSPFLDETSLLNKKVSTGLSFKESEKEYFTIFKEWGDFSRRNNSRLLDLSVEKKDKSKEDEGSTTEFFQKLKLPQFFIKYPLE